MFARFAVLSTKLMGRTAALIALGEAAADVDPELAEQRDRVHGRQTATNAGPATVLGHRGALAPGLEIQDAADIIYAIAGNEHIYTSASRAMRMDRRPLRQPHRAHPQSTLGVKYISEHLLWTEGGNAERDPTRTSLVPTSTQFAPSRDVADLSLRRPRAPCSMWKRMTSKNAL